MALPIDRAIKDREKDASIAFSEDRPMHASMSVATQSKLPFNMLSSATAKVATLSSTSNLDFVNTIQTNTNVDVVLPKLCLRLKSCLEKIGQEKSYTPQIKALLNELTDTLREMESFRAHMDETRFASLKAFFVDHILPMTNQSVFCKYAYEKPRGYAGDFVMMEMIWKGRVKDKHYKFEGSSFLGEIINAYTLDLDNCKANEWRIKKISHDLLNAGCKRIASVGSGSAIELEPLFFYQSKGVESVDFFDQDSGALDHCLNKYKDVGVSLTAHEGNIVKSILRCSRSYDFIYSSGMFDYFSIDSSKKLIQNLWKRVSVGGTLLITNANPNNPSRLWLELVGDWYLSYKSQQEMLSLALALPSIQDVRLETDPFGVYQYISILKSS